MSLATITNSILSFLTLLLVIAVVVGLGVLGMQAILRRPSPFLKKLVNLVARRALWLGFFFALFSTLSSLFYSEIIGYAPCTLCWYQRIAMYPLVVILGVGALHKDKRAALYAALLSGIGLVIAVYHYFIQVFQTNVVCAVGEVSCTSSYTFAYGFITIPFMALACFGTILLLMYLYGYRKNDQKT